ncbi:MAG: AMP-binding protein [Ignavibacteriaceae bacterium]
MISPVLVHEYLTLSAQKFPNKPAIIFKDKRITFKELNEKSSKFAYSLKNLGINKQDRIIIFIENSSDIVISLLGILKVGAIFIILNEGIKSEKLNYILKDSSSKIIITSSNKINIVNQALDGIIELPKIILIGETSEVSGKIQSKIIVWEEAINNFGEKINDYNEPVNNNVIDYDLAALIYTSGTTGEPKGVMATHFNMLAVSRSIIQYLENCSEDIILNVLPLSFGYGLYQVITSIICGGTVIIQSSFMFPIQIFQLIEKEKVTGFPIVPTIYALLFDAIKNINNFNLSSLRYLTNAGAALSTDRILKLKEMLPTTKIYSMYGLTECQRVSYLHPSDIEKKPASVGKAIPNCETFIINEKGEPAAVGEVGELVIRGSNVMRGYWNAPELTKKTFREGKIPGEKLLYSGDLFKKDSDDFLYFVSRKDDIIKTKGEKVSPKEVEHIICEMNNLMDAAVISVPDKILGNAIKAYVVKKKIDDFDISENDVLKFCSERLEPFMVPKYIEFIDELPKGLNGKIDKKILKDLNKIIP